MNGLRKKRIEKGLSQAALGSAVGITQQLIYAYEKGTREPRLSVIKKLIAVLGCRFEDLL